ncbi:Cro/CI family transcriptional regulator [Candidiatus Paracoxiella cheracis]|uniref:Cro/CI family transcriptional regulator n=1 Tax=Candidiatus Paracoxiella cheracis TaxID=3405120 RepID=UPI003BF4AF01
MKYSASHFHRVVQYFGGISPTEKALNIKPQAIHQWKNIPLGRSYQIESLTKGQFRA